MNVLHYAGVRENKASGVSVIVPQIIGAQAELMNVCFYNYGETSFKINNRVLCMNNRHSDDYHTFPSPFNKPDIVVFHSPFGIPKSTHIATMLKRDNISYIIVPHGSFSDTALAKKRLKKWLALQIYFKKMFTNASAVQFLSKGEKIVSAYYEKGIIIPNGVIIPSNIEQRHKRKKGIILSFIGRKDIYHKGLDLIVKACATVKNKLYNSGVSIHLYGPYEDSNGSNLKSLISENSVEDIIFDCPPVFGKDKEKVFLETDIVFLTSRFEGLPGIVLEAWAHGCPILLTIGSNMAEEAVQNNCGWKAKNEIQDIASTLIDICEHPDEIARKSDAAALYVRKKYNWKNIVELYYDEYKKIIERT